MTVNSLLNKPMEQEHFIPITVKDLVSSLSVNLDLTESEKQLFRRFCKIYIALYHAKFFDKLQILKDYYLPFSPDRTTLPLKQFSAEELKDKQINLIEQIQGIIEKANYTCISQQELNEALSESSPYGLDVAVDFEDFDEIHLYYQGTATKTESTRNWRTLYLKPETVEVAIYRRLFLVLKLKNSGCASEPVLFSQSPKQYLLNKWQSLFELKLTDGGESSLIYLKLFKDIPRTDLEMLFPNTRVEMKRFDKVTMGVSGGGGILAAGTKLFRAAHPTAILFTVAGFIGIIWREVGKLLSNRNRYMATLAKSLYFHNLDNNLGVLANLIEMAEAEECKEFILTYGFLSQYGDKECTRVELDLMVENYLLQTFSVKVDFELKDGIEKLQEAGLLEQSADNKLKVCSLEQAVKKLDREWDDMFSFADVSSE